VNKASLGKVIKGKKSIDVIKEAVVTVTLMFKETVI